MLQYSTNYIDYTNFGVVKGNSWTRNPGRMFPSSGWHLPGMAVLHHKDYFM